MPSRQSLSSKLAKARQQLEKAQSRVAALEAQVAEGTPNFAKLAISEDRYHRTLDMMLEGCQIIGFDWRYVYVNDTAARHGQRPQHELLGYTMMERYPGIEKTQLFAVLQRCMQERRIERIEHEFPYPDGTSAWFELRVQPVPEGIFILSLDITARKQAAENIRKLHRTLGVLSDINQAIVRIRHLPALFEKACEIAVEKGAFRMAWLGLFDPNTGRIEPATSAGITANDLEKIISTLNTPPLLPALRAGERLICNDIQTDARWLLLRAEALRLGYCATVALPLLVDGEIRGSFNLYAGETAFFDEQEMRLMDEMAGDISFAIEVAEQDEQRLQAEAALRISEEKYRSLIESSESVIAVFDGEGTFLFANRVAAAGLGLTPEILSGRKLAHVFPPPTAQEQLAQIRQVIQTGEGTIYEAIRVVLGETRWYRTSMQPIRDVSGEITSTLVNAVDITRLKRAEADLLNERDTLEQKVAERTVDLQAALVRVEAILNNSPDAILLVDADLTIQQTNPSFKTLFSATLDEDLGQSLLTLLHPDDVHPISNLPQIAAAQQNGNQLEVRAIRKDGTTFDAELNIGAIKGDGLVCIIRDITDRKAQERQLRYHASLQESVSDAVIATDMQFRIQSWNRTAELIYGWRAGEAIGQSVSEILQATYGSAADGERILRDFFERGAWQGEVIQHHRDGRLIHIHASVNLFKDETGQPIGVVSVNRDITEQKRAAAALQKSAAEIHDLYNNAPCGYHSIDQDGLIVQINDTELQWLGYTREQVIDRLKVTALFTPESVLLFQQIFPGFIAQGWMNDVEVDMVRKDGRIMHILLNATAIYDDEGQYQKSRSTLFDITELQQAQRAILERETRYRLLAENISDVLVKINADGIRTFITPSCYRLLGYTPAELIGQPRIDIVHPDDRPHVLAAFGQAVCDGKTTFSFSGRFRHKAGHDIWVDVTNNIIYDQDTGQLLESIGVVRDATERKKAETALREAEHRYRALFEQSHNAIFLVDMRGKVLEVNQRAAEMLGYSIEALLTLSYRELSDEVPQSEWLIQQLLAGKSVPMYERVMRKRDGSRISVEINVAIVRDLAGNPRHIQSVVRDITERKLAEATLRTKMAEEHQFQTYLKALHEIIIELTGIDQLDTFYQRAVELGRERLGFERLAMFLYDEGDDSAIGTYGTDTEGKLVDERGVRFTPDPNGVMQRSFERIERFYVKEETTLYNEVAPVGYGWNAAAALWNGTRNLGWFVADNLLRHEPASKPLLDTIGLYGLSVGTLLVQKQAQLALKESEALYRLLAENLADVIMTFSLDRLITYMSPSCEKLLGYLPAEVQGKSQSEFIHPEDYGQVTARTRQAVVAKEDSYTNQFRIRHKTGHYIWYEVRTRVVWERHTGKVAQFVSVLRDITERKQAEDALRASEEKYRSLVETMRGGLAVFDTAFRVTFVNDRFCELLGYAREEVIGQQPLRFVDAAELPLVQSYLERRQRTENTSYEVPLRHKDGHQIYMLMSGSPLLDQQGEFNGSIVVATDITIQKQAEATLRQALAKEKELGDLKTRFVSMASHEFRTPLATILAVVETLSIYRHKLSEEQIDKRFDKIKDQVGHLKDIMEDVLMLARMQARHVEFNPAKLDLDALARSVLDEFQSQADIKHRLEYRVSDESHEVLLDRKLMRQIISNLVSNAIKYSPAGTVVHIQLEYTDALIILTVSDEGIGIPTADLPHLFEPFHRAANVGTISGTGLGLVITREAVELHSGTITVESQQGVGTTFLVHIPIATGGEAQNDENPI